MKDIRLSKLAHLLVNYSLELKKGEYVLIAGNTVAAPLLTELFREALKVGAHPEVIPTIEEVQEIFLKEASDEQLNFISPLNRLKAEKYDAFIGLWGEENTRALSGIDPERMAARYRATAELTQIRAKREENGEFRWCGTMFPTQGQAQDANMSLADYEDFVFQAGLLHKENPIAEWRKISEQQQKIVDYLNTKKELRIVSKDTDLTLGIAGRKWINCDGKINFPDGEVFTGPIENSVNGKIRFSYPGIFSGQEIEDIRLEFRDGVVVEASATKNEKLLHSLLETDPGARRLGEIAIGTNYQIQTFTKHMLFDEKMGGTVHAALGRSIPGTGGQNESGIHWDMLCDMKTGGRIYADGELFYKDGQFLDEVISRKDTPRLE
ncbi:MAG: aminopeptidase [Firmicutes bacterium]|nr:aminopeptidase [Bacillota bacterium]